MVELLPLSIRPLWGGTPRRSQQPGPGGLPRSNPGRLRFHANTLEKPKSINRAEKRTWQLRAVIGDPWPLTRGRWEIGLFV
jgi:hypothetical protein